MNGVWRFYGNLCILLPLGSLRLCACTFSLRCAERYTLQIQILHTSYIGLNLIREVQGTKLGAWFTLCQAAAPSNGSG